MMSTFLSPIYNIGECAIAKPMTVIMSGIATVLLSTGISTTDFASQYPGIMIAIISTIGAFCLVLIGVIYRNQMLVNTEVLAGLKELRIEIKEDREKIREDYDKIKEEQWKHEENMNFKIQVIKEEVYKADVAHAAMKQTEKLQLISEIGQIKKVIENTNQLIELIKDKKLV